MTGKGDPAMPRGTWRYRVVRQTHDGETLYGIHEAYDGGTSWTANPVAPVAETVDELRDVLTKMTTALEQPVLTDTTPPAVNPPPLGPPVMCAYCRDEFGPDELVDGDIAEVVCSTCAKAGRTVHRADRPGNCGPACSEMHTFEPGRCEAATAPTDLRAATRDHQLGFSPPETYAAAARQALGGPRHWSTVRDEDGEPYGELCWCTETSGDDH